MFTSGEPFFDQYWFRFLVGGFVVATTTSLAAHANTKLAAIVWSAPITLLPTLLFLWNDKTSSKRISQFAVQTLYALGNLLIFVLALAMFMKLHYFKTSENGILWATFISFLFWAAGSSILYFFG